MWRGLKSLSFCIVSANCWFCHRNVIIATQQKLFNYHSGFKLPPTHGIWTATDSNSAFCLVASGFDGNIDSQGELILQESFQVWDPKTLIRKGRDRHLFLFEMSLVFSKEVKDSNGHSKYLYKSKLFVSNWHTHGWASFFPYVVWLQTFTCIFVIFTCTDIRAGGDRARGGGSL